MKSKNFVELIGNVGNDPEVKAIQNSKTVANFSVATNEIYTNEKGEKVKNTTWHRVTCWGNLALIIKDYVKKGSPIQVEGKLVPREYSDQDGTKHHTYEIVVKDLILLGSRPNGEEPLQEQEPETDIAPDTSFEKGKGKSKGK